MMQLLQIVKAGLPSATITQKAKDIIVKSKDREASKTTLEKYLKLKKVDFESVFKKAKSSSIDVLSVAGIGDIIFKPVIQKGAGGLSFEKELDIDLTNYFSGADMADIKHKDVIKALETKIGINQESNMSVFHEGSKNQKRSLTYAANKITISNSSGETLTDITIKDSKNKKTYLSLKMSSSYYILSASIGSYFSNKTTQTGICEYFGFDGKSMGGFGDEFSCKTSAPNYVKVKQNLEDLLTQSYGKHVVVIHKKRDNDVKVNNIGEKVTLSLGVINAASYVYPELGKRKYANIKTTATINGAAYKVNFQFRGTTAADVGPKYLRILLERT
jgi:hypothetical protein